MEQNDYRGFCMEEQPQYKAYNNGYENLTVVELISLILGTGTQKNVEQARQIYNIMEQSLHKLGRSRKEEITVVQGVGDSKANALYAAIELGKRYRLILSTIFNAIGCRVEVEKMIATGRIDMVVETSTFIYVLELKLSNNGGVDAAAEQIKAKQYAEPFKADKRKIIALAVELDDLGKGLVDWKEV